MLHILGATAKLGEEDRARMDGLQGGPVAAWPLSSLRIPSGGVDDRKQIIFGQLLGQP